MTRITGVLFVLIPVFCLFLGGASGGDEQAKFSDQSPKEKVATMEDWTKKQNDDLAAFTDYFAKNWDKDPSATAAFCKMVMASRTTQAIPLLVAHIDFTYGPQFISSLRSPLDYRYALIALIKIGVPALEPAVAQIIKSLDALPDNDEFENKVRRVSLLGSLQALSVEILGKDLGLAYLRLKLEDKDLSPKAMVAIATAIKQIQSGIYLAPMLAEPAPPPDAANP